MLKKLMLFVKKRNDIEIDERYESALKQQTASLLLRSAWF